MRYTVKEVLSPLADHDYAIVLHDELEGKFITLYRSKDEPPITSEEGMLLQLTEDETRELDQRIRAELLKCGLGAQ